MSTHEEIDEAMNLIARFLGRAVGVSGDLDALEALTTVKYHVTELEAKAKVLERNSEHLSSLLEARQNEAFGLEAALREIVELDDKTYYDDPSAGFAAIARRALEKEEA